MKCDTCIHGDVCHDIKTGAAFLDDFECYEYEPQKPKGQWHHSGECSVCHKRSLRTTPLGEIIGLDFTDFCKNCGADMRGSDND